MLKFFLLIILSFLVVFFFYSNTLIVSNRILAFINITLSIIILFFISIEIMLELFQSKMIYAAGITILDEINGIFKHAGLLPH